MRISVLALSVLLLVGGLAAAQDVMRPSEVGADQVGKKVAVEGRIYSNAKTGAGVHLYFGADTSTAFQAIIATNSIYKFKVDVQKKFSRRNVRVTGEVEEEQGKHFIRITDPKQIKVVARKRKTS